MGKECALPTVTAGCVRTVSSLRRQVDEADLIAQLEANLMKYLYFPTESMKLTLAFGSCISNHPRRYFQQLSLTGVKSKRKARRRLSAKSPNVSVKTQESYT